MSKSCKLINDFPFSPVIMKRSEKIVEKYNIVLQQDGNQWVGHVLEYPEAIGIGDSAELCIVRTREVAISGVATMLEMGQKPPVAARPGIRSEQANIRMTKEEKARLEAVAKQKGFRGLSDFIRAAALEHAR